MSGADLRAARGPELRAARGRVVRLATPTTDAAIDAAPIDYSAYARADGSDGHVLHLMAEGYIVPTLNLDEVDERCAMIHHSREVRDYPVRIAAVQNFAFGGVNTNLFIKKPD